MKLETFIVCYLIVVPTEFPFYLHPCVFSNGKISDANRIRKHQELSLTSAILSDELVKSRMKPSFSYDRAESIFTEVWSVSASSSIVSLRTKSVSCVQLNNTKPMRNLYLRIDGGFISLLMWIVWCLYHKNNRYSYRVVQWGLIVLPSTICSRK